MAKGAWIVLGLLSMVLVLSSPGTVKAAGGEGSVVVFRLPATNGYRLEVLAGGRPSGRGEADLFVGNGRAVVVYKVPATLTETSFEADLGGLGRISMQAQPSGEEATAHSKCDKRPLRYEPVDYVGEFEFHGEGGYAEASASRLPVRFDDLASLVCGGAVMGESRGPGSPGAGLEVKSRGGSARVSLQARTNGPGKPVSIAASIAERRGRIRIKREVGSTGSDSIFGYSADLSSARLSPPSPFSGHATFRRAPDPKRRWTGDLRVDFPGRPGVALTGRRFSVSLIHGEWQGPSSLAARPSRPNLPEWPSTKPWPTVFATSSPPGPS